MSSVFRDRPNRVPPSYNPIPDHFTPLPQQRKPRDEGKVRTQYYTDIKRMFYRKPTHTSLSQTDFDIAVATHSIYKPDPAEYLFEKGSPFRIIRKVSPNVMSLRNTMTGEEVVVVKGIDPFKASDLEDVATLTQFSVTSDNTTNSKVYQEAIAEARRIDADAVYGHSRGSNVSQMIGAELDIPSVGFNGYISPQSLYNRITGKAQSLHIEHSNLADPVGTLGDLTGLSLNSSNFELRTYAPIKGGSVIDQHDMPQYTDNLERHPSHAFEDIDVIATSNKITDISTAQMFHRGVQQGKTYTDILKEHEGGFGILNEDGSIGVRGGHNSNMSQMFQAVGGEHTMDEVRQMDRLPRFEETPMRLSEQDILDIRAGKGVQMMHDIHDTIADTYSLPTGAKWNASSMARASGGMLVAGLIGEGVARGVDKISPLKGEAKNLEHSGVAFGVASGLLEGASSMGLGVVAGVGGEASRAITEKVMHKIGVNEEVAHNLSAFTSGATSGAIMGSTFGAPGALVGGLIGGVANEAMYLLPKLFHKVA